MTPNLLMISRSLIAKEPNPIIVVSDVKKLGVIKVLNSSFSGWTICWFERKTKSSMELMANIKKREFDNISIGIRKKARTL